MKKMVYGTILVTFILMFITCASQQVSDNQYEKESLFLVEIIDNGEAIKIEGYIGKSKKLNIPPKINDLPVVEIGNQAFAKKKLTNVTIPDGVRSIGAQAFSLNDLSSIIIPDTVTSIGGLAFDSLLSNITIGANVNLAQFSFTVGGFITFYNENEKRAGNYNWTNGKWNFQEL